MRILYLHGLGSSGGSATAKGLQGLGYDLIAPDYAPQHYGESIVRLRQVIDECSPDVVVGTSMGGYYALKLFERYRLPTVAVNPCYEPRHLLDPYLSQPAWDYAGDQPIHFSPSMLEAFEPFVLAEDEGSASRLRVVIGRNDALIAAAGQRDFCARHGLAWVETEWGHRVGDVDELGVLIAGLLASLAAG